jgi:hypothetical protein
MKKKEWNNAVPAGRQGLKSACHCRAVTACIARACRRADKYFSRFDSLTEKRIATGLPLFGTILSHSSGRVSHTSYCNSIWESPQAVIYY